MQAQSTIWAHEPVQVKRGDIWQLGNHRLMCGDSTNAEDVAALMQGGNAQAVITDPPYGTIHALWDTVTFSFIAPMTQVLAKNATIVLFCSLPFGFNLHAAMLQSEYQWRWDAVWTKVSGGFQVSKQMPRPAHEHLFAYARKDTAISSLVFNGWDAGEVGKHWTRTSQGLGDTAEVYARPFQAQSKGDENGKRWIRSVVEGKEKAVMLHSERTKHPTQKPFEIVKKLALLLVNPGELIYDPFLGSGTTLISAENVNRRCYGMELSESYCNDIIQRWQAQTGRVAQSC